MKKILTTIFAFGLISLCSAQNYSENYKKFIKGNIADKTESIKKASGQESFILAESGINFAIQNKEILGHDRELSTLAVASILSLPQDEKLLKENISDYKEKFIKIFELYEDSTVKIAILSKIEGTSPTDADARFISLVNNYLSDVTAQENESPVIPKAIQCISKIGNEKSFNIIYPAWKENRFPKFEKDLENALIQLSVNNMPAVVKVFSGSNISEIYKYFSLIKENPEISRNFKAEIAENALSVAIHNTEELSGKMQDSVRLQLESLNLISSLNWTRASQLATRYFSLAKEEYDANVLTEAQFITVIEDITKLASSDCAATLSGYLAELNSNTEKNLIPAKNVVIAVIKALGALGDKSAFDNLLYVTYINTSEEVKNAARESLAKLKW